MNKKRRIPIPDVIATEILFLHDRTCCVCTTPGKRVQIHHINEDPEDNNISNLCVLCFDCHDETMITGGIGRKLDSNLLRKYKDNWIERVRQRKQKADEIASLKSVTGITENILVVYKTKDGVSQRDNFNYQKLLVKYLIKIAVIKQAQLSIAMEKWETGVNSIMNQGNYDMIDFYEEVLLELSTFYPQNHFNGMLPQQYFNEIISAKFLWYRLILEPEGVGSGGTIINNIVGNNVMVELKKMIVDVVQSLVNSNNLDGEINLNKWIKSWLK
jgi:hypothetical protein